MHTSPPSHFDSHNPGGLPLRLPVPKPWVTEHPRCDHCGVSIAGRTPFLRLQYSYCTTLCVREHMQVRWPDLLPPPFPQSPPLPAQTATGGALRAGGAAAVAARGAAVAVGKLSQPARPVGAWMRWASRELPASAAAWAQPRRRGCRLTPDGARAPARCASGGGETSPRRSAFRQGKTWCLNTCDLAGLPGRRFSTSQPSSLRLTGKRIRVQGAMEPRLTADWDRPVYPPRAPPAP